MSTISSYLQISNNLSKWQAITAKQPDVAVQTTYFQNNIGNVKTAADLIKNPRLFNYAMTAFGLGDMTYATGMMKQVLAQSPNSSTALAAKLNNPAIRAFARAFDFADNGAATTSSSSLVANIVNAYTENALETNQGQQNPGVQLALYFQKQAPSVTSVYGILADKKLLNVVQTALGISPLTSAEPIDMQYQLLSAKLNVKDFQDPKKLQTFISRFSAMYDANTNDPNNPNYTGSSISNVLLLDAASGGSGSTFGLDPTLMLSATSVHA